MSSSSGERTRSRTESWEHVSQPDYYPALPSELSKNPIVETVAQHEAHPSSSFLSEEPRKDRPSALMQHVAFFDRDGDGTILPWETWTSFRILGFNPFMSFIAVVLIHGSMSYPSLDTWVPDPFFGIEVRNIHRCKHGSDTGIFTHQGDLDMDRMTQVFGHGGTSLLPSKAHVLHSLGSPAPSNDLLSHYGFKELMVFLRSNQVIWDPYGWIAAFFEWSFLYILAGDGKLTKDLILGQYDGSAFVQIEEAQR